MRHKIILSSFISALFFAAPATLAQNECGVQVGDTVTCPPDDYNNGITYLSLGDLTLEVPNGAADFNVFENGVNVTGNGTDNIFWDSSAYTSGKITGTGVLIDYLSGTGDIDIVTGSIVMGTDDATHAIRAESTGGGDVAVTAQDDINVRVGFSDPDPSGIGIEALTTSGNITIDTLGQVHSGRAGGLYAIHAASSAGGNIDISAEESIFGQSSGSASHGILAETTGAGAITIDVGGLVLVSSSSPNAVAGLEAVTDSGDITLMGEGNIIGSSGVIARTGGASEINLTLSAAQGDARNDPGANAIRAVTGTGDITIDVEEDVDQRGGGSAIFTQTDGLATINTGSSVRADSLGDFGLAVQSIGHRAVVNTTGIRGGLDFSGLSGFAELHIGADPLGEDDSPDWIVRNDYPAQVFSGGDDLVTVAAGRTMSLPVVSTSSTVASPSVTVDFGAGDDSFEFGGIIWVGPKSGGFNTPDNYPGELRLENLETFQFAGTLWLGRNFATAFGTDRDFVISRTDRHPDDMLTAPGVHWVGAGDNRIELDVDLNQTSANGQTGCNDGFRDANDDLPSADCLNLAGGSASGRTFIKVEQRIPGDRGAYNPGGIVLVDLAGGDPAATDPRAFAVHPDSQQYSPVHGGIVDKGIFIYPVGFDAETQQFKIYGLPGPTGQQWPLMAQVTNELWRTATDSWFDRRVDQRDVDLGAGTGGGAWFRATSREGERDVISSVLAGSTNLDFDNSYTQDDSALTFGVDLVSRADGDTAWVVGGMIGYTRSRVSFGDSLNRANFEGVHAGVYGSAMFGDLFIDAAVNGNWTGMDADVPSVNLEPEGTLASTDIASLGARIEAGWHWRMSDRLTIEPLAGLSYVRSSFDRLNVPAANPNRFGAEMRLDDPVSNRGSLGVRARLDNVLPGFVPTSVGLTARAIEEFDGEAKGSIVNLGPLDAPVTDTFDGTFGQVTGDVSITNTAKTAAGFLKVDAVTGDDYDSLGVSAGFRYQW